MPPERPDQPAAVPAGDAVAPLNVDAVVHATFASAPDGLAVFDRDGVPVAYNAAFVTLWNFPPALLQRRQPGELRDWASRQLKDPGPVLRRLQQQGQAGSVPTLDEVERSDGRVFERQSAPLDSAGFPGLTVVRWRDISDRRRAEAALKQAQARLAALFDHALNAILLADDQGRCLDANPAACALLGLAREQLLATAVDQVMAMPGSAFEATWAEFLRQGSATGDVSLQRSDGSTRIARFSAVAHILPGVHLSIMTDVTEERQSRQRLLEAAAQMETAMTSADVVFWSVDLVRDEVAAANPDWLQQTLGYAPGEIAPGMAAWNSLVHPDDVEHREAAWQAHVQGSSPGFESEFRMRHKDGRWIWMLSRGRAMERDASGKATRVVGTRIDITRRKLAEQQLQEQAFTDGLTHTLNRRRFLELAEVEMARSRRHDQPLALLMIDLDHFKAVNDRHGHAGGDAVLQAFVRTASQITRGSDLFGRVGGEEFAALLPQTDLGGGTAFALRLQALVQSQPVALPKGLVRYTVSIGVAARAAGTADPSTVESLMLAADTALYGAKHSGRNRVRRASAPR